MSDEWWREKIPEGEQVLWFGHPYSGFFPPHLGWSYRILIGAVGLAWLASPWFADTVRDFWKLISCTGVLAFVMWADRYFRSQRVYVVTSRNAWQINKEFKPKKLEINRFLNFRTVPSAVVFARHPFFRFDHLSDPDAALAALTQAQEAQT